MIRHTLLAVALLTASTDMAQAEDCLEKFKRLYVEWMDNGNARGLMVTEIKGQTRTENEMLLKSWSHYMMKPVKPAGAWLLTHDGTTYQSTDQGKSWKKAYSFNKEDTRARNVASIKAQAAGARNAVCGTAELDGVTYDTIEVEIVTEKPSKLEMHNKYWLDPKTDFVAKSTSKMVTSNFESFGTQTWVRVENMELPTVE